jgi:hypothetical protein
MTELTIDRAREARANAGAARAAGALLVRLVLLVAGCALVLSALGIWLVSATVPTPGLLLMKLGVSLFLVMCGLVLVTLARSTPDRG